MSLHDLEHDIPERLRELKASASEPAWDAMEQRLLEVFADCYRSRASHPAAAAPNARHWGLAAVWQVAAAGLVALAAAMTFYPWPEPRRVPPPKQADARYAGAKTQTLPEPGAPRGTPGVLQKNSHVPGRNSKPGTRVSKVLTGQRDTSLPMSGALAAVFSDFVALPGASSLPDFESGRIMRIELPLTGLPAYGLDMVLDAAPGAIEADLLVGQDGIPRAIRLASTESR
jgi:hypothetical protein